MDGQSGFYKSVEAYVGDRAQGFGGRPIKKILIANNGVGAVKAIRSIRRWAYTTFGNNDRISFVVMATPDDMRANAEYIRMADEIVDVPGGTNNNNYANVMLIVEIAERWNVDAVWAGWGHASENPLLPDSLEKTDRKIIFIGPSGGPMRALGDKIGSTIIAQSVGVSCIPWNGDALKCNYKDEGEIPQSTYDKANVTSLEMCVSECERVGFPIMIKASEGGGGKGVRKVTSIDEVPAAFRQVQGEVPGSPIFCMKMASGARHLEVQLLADAYGQAIALNGRDCSVQRRYQKIIEEGPPVACVDKYPEVWHQMEQAAVALAQEVNYCNAGTVEYLFTVATQEFAFLELNPRLQVEHPVTEMITKANLPACQLQVAMGIPLHRIPDVRALYGKDPLGTDQIDFATERRIPPTNHCIAVRITAENPDQGFKPTSGNIMELNFRSTPDVWGYFSIDSSGLVHEFADSQFGHLFANGANRELARKNMIVALQELSIRGDIRTTMEYIVDMMQSDEFIENKISTQWLDGLLAKGSIEAATGQNNRPDPLTVVLVGGLVTFSKKIAGLKSDFEAMVNKGQYPSEGQLIVDSPIELIYEDVKYKLIVAMSAARKFTVTCNGSYIEADMRELPDSGYLININTEGGRSFNAYMTEEATGARLILDGKTCLFSKEYDPTNLSTDVAGKFARMLVEEGTHLEAGEPYAEIEVMKMFMPLKAGEAGVIRWKMQEGAPMNAGDVLATMELDHPELVKTASLFDGKLPGNKETVVDSSRPHVILRQAETVLESVMNGFAVPSDTYETAINNLGDALKNPLLPLFEFEEALSVLNGRIDGTLFDTLSGMAAKFRADVASGAATEFPIMVVRQNLIDHAAGLLERDRAAFETSTAALRAVTEQYTAGIGGRSVSTLLRLIRAYLDIERTFSGRGFQEAVQQLRRQHGDASTVFDICRSHNSIKRKNGLIMTLLEHVRTASEAISSSAAGALASPVGSPKKGSMRRNTSLNTLLEATTSAAVDLSVFHPVLTELGTLTDKQYGTVCLEARKLLIEQNMPSLESRHSTLRAVLDAAVDKSPAVGAPLRIETMEVFLRTNTPVRDVFLEFLKDPSNELQLACLELYIRKVYVTHTIRNIEGGSMPATGGGDMLFIQFGFSNMAADALPPGVSPQMSTADLKTLTTNRSFSDAADLSDGAGSEMEAASYSKVDPKVTRQGIFVKCVSYDQMTKNFDAMIAKIPQIQGADPVNCIHIAIVDPSATGEAEAKADELMTEDNFAATASAFLSTYVDALSAKGVRRVTFMVFMSDGELQSFKLPNVFTFRARSGFQEDSLFRNIEPSYAFQLDLLRLSNFQVQLAESLQTQVGNVHVYSAVPKKALATKAGIKELKQRFFVRVLSITAQYLPSESERMFVESLNALELKMAEYEESYPAKNKGKPAPPLTSNHIFLNIVAPDTIVELADVEEVVRKLMSRYSDKLSRLGVAHFELKMVCRFGADSAPVPLRILASNPTGYVLHIDSYVEQRDVSMKNFVFKTINGKPGIWEGKDITAPYEIVRPFERQRAAALASSDTLYCYDYLELFTKSVEDAWAAAAVGSKRQVIKPARVLDAVELVVCKKSAADEKWSLADAEAGLTDLVETVRPPGLNNVGMVAWLVTMRTPEYPEGREMVLIANDITHVQGSFGTREDVVFKKASELARERRLPRLYIAANSGARIGLAQSVRLQFKVQWNDEADPTSGFKYIYLTPEAYAEYGPEGKKACKGSRIYEGDEERYVLTDVIGEEPDLGVENLRGSGMIAGETSTAYKDIFTLTIVTGRSVGIGAYLVRLGQRCIQKTNNGPIILTGYQALNKLMGKQIYTTNDQLGGPMIMYPNGVSHLLADNHLDCVTSAVKWLSYVPSVRGMPLPIVDITGVDMVERPVQYYPKKGEAYDPRLLLTGEDSGLEGEWVSGFFDRGSFTETLAGWAKTVICGRARLGGIPMGVIVTENRTVEALTPADPADPTSVERNTFQAGGVWFPDSAYKTAQAINDFNAEDLPIIIFANWRGFSGGQRDMFDEVLKFGAMIVDALVAFHQPIFVYIPPFAELRGGAWVVVDSTINPNVMEFFAAEDSRGGVLEAEAIAGIKYRQKDLVVTAHRLDPELQALDKQLADDAAPDAPLDARLDEAARAEIKTKITKRENHLMGIYQQIAVQFADLHDTPGRMEATGVIVQEVQWAQSRSFFYWRLRRRLAEFQLRQQICKYDAELTADGASSVIRKWFLESGQSPAQWVDSKFVLAWMASKQSLLREQLERLRQNSVETQTRELALDCPDAAARGLVTAFQQMDYMQREILRQQLGAITGGVMSLG